MFAVKAVYDGNRIEPVQPIEVQGRYEVIITFVQQIDDPNSVSQMPQNTSKNPRVLREPDTSKIPVLGRLSSSIKISDDFDEPLEEMKEYMY